MADNPRSSRGRRCVLTSHGIDRTLLKVSLVTRYTRNLIISVRWRSSGGDFPGRRIRKTRSADISGIGKLSSLSPHNPLAAPPLLFIIFQHSRRQMYLCPRARAAPFISRFCRRSTYTLRTSFPRLSLSSGPLFCPPASPAAFPYPFTSRLALDFLVFRLLPLPHSPMSLIPGE